jgi:hypothetical protein
MTCRIPAKDIPHNNLVIQAAWEVLRDLDGKAQSLVKSRFIGRISKITDLPPRLVKKIILRLGRYYDTVFDAGTNGDTYYPDIPDYLYDAKQIKAGLSKWGRFPKYNHMIHSASGEGSTPEASAGFCAIINSLAVSGKKCTLFDPAAGDCMTYGGDGQGHKGAELPRFQSVNFGDLSDTALRERAKPYIDKRWPGLNVKYFPGMDIVESVEALMTQLADTERLVIVCKTVFQHMMFGQITAALESIRKIRAPEVIFISTNMLMAGLYGQMDCLPYGYRPINLEDFDLPPTVNFRQATRTNNRFENQEWLSAWRLVEGEFVPLTRQEFLELGA